MESSLISFADVDLLSIPSPVVIQQESQSQYENTAGELAGEEISDEVSEQQGNILDNQVPNVSTSSPDLKQVMSPRASGDEALREPQQQRVVNNPAVCWKCNSAVVKAAKFCNECGTSQLKKECLECGAENKPTAKFCSDCGKSCGPKRFSLTPGEPGTPSGFMTPKGDREIPDLPKFQRLREEQSEYFEGYEGEGYEDYYPSQQQIMEDLQARSDLVNKGTSADRENEEYVFAERPQLSVEEEGKPSNADPFMVLLAKSMDAQSERQTELMQVLKDGMVKKRDEDNVNNKDIKLQKFEMREVGERALDLDNWEKESKEAFKNISDEAAMFWSKAMDSVKKAYATYIKSTALEKLKLQPEIVDDPKWKRIRPLAGEKLRSVIPKEMKDKMVRENKMEFEHVMFELYIQCAPGGKEERRILLNKIQNPFKNAEESKDDSIKGAIEDCEPGNREWPG